MAVVASKMPSGLTVDFDGKVVTFAGSNDKGAIAGFGMTRDVDADWFKKWAAKHPDFPPIKNNSLFIAKDADEAGDMAKERTKDAAVQTGLEGMDPDKPGVGLEPTDEQKKETDKAKDAKSEKDAK